MKKLNSDSVGTEWATDTPDQDPQRTEPTADESTFAGASKTPLSLTGRDSADSQMSTVPPVFFRFAFLYFLIQALPLDWRFYRDLFTIDWGQSYYRDLFNLSKYAPHFFGPEDTFVNWAVVALIALVGTLIWSLLDRKQTDYKALNYGLRVLLRYRLAIGVLAYGFIKLFPLQAPLPSISNLNTAYGDFTAWKLFSLSLGIVPSYESFLGLVEIIGGLLLLNRRTATIGTLIIIPFTGNVFISNLAYEGGEYVYSFYLITIALYLFAHDAIRLINLLTFEKPTAPDRYKPVFVGWQRTARLTLKSAFIFFAVLLYGYKTYAAYRTGPYQFPQTPGLSGAAGLYTVREFRLASQPLPYARNNSVRWQDVVFETWNTISIKSNRPVILDKTNTEQIHAGDAGRDYELAGSAGRHYYSYSVDSVGHVLTLKNRNPNYPNETLRLHYERPSTNEITLSGLNENGDSVHVVLDKLNKKYLLDEAAKTGRWSTLKL